MRNSFFRLKLKLLYLQFHLSTFVLTGTREYWRLTYTYMCLYHLYIGRLYIIYSVDVYRCHKSNTSSVLYYYNMIILRNRRK